MENGIDVFLFGSLMKKRNIRPIQSIRLNLKSPTPLLEVLELLNIRPGEISLAMVNHKSVPKDWSVSPGDRLSLFPREYPIFADWLDHRLNV